MLFTGDTFELGMYDQNLICKTPIEWIVIRTEENLALALSKLVLDAQPYHKDTADVTWEKSSLHRWLNVDFFWDAFSASEQEKIVVPCGTQLSGKVFLLSDQEINYVPTNERLGEVTAKVLEKNVFLMIEKETGRVVTDWWLRSCATEMVLSAHFIDDDGYFNPYGFSMNCELGVRPAIWVENF